MNILIIEDEVKVSDFMEQSLREAGYDPVVALDGCEGVDLWRAKSPDIVLLDVMLPDGDGLVLLRKMREEGWTTPVMVLTAKDALPDRVAGLDAGADDYLSKPFQLEEMLARVRALLRRRALDTTSIKVGDLEIDVRSRRVVRDGRVVFLSGTEFSLLELLARHPSSVVSKSEILRHVWDDDGRDPNVVEVYINYLRHKLERGGSSRLIHTVRGRGYTLQQMAEPPTMVRSG